MTDAAMSDSLDSEIALPTYEVLARFRSSTATEQEAIADVTRRLATAQEPCDEITVERQEEDGSWMVVARYVLVSVDAHTAVVGLDETLRSAGLAPDEVWADHQLS